MLDNLRDQASSSAYFQEEEAPAFEAQPAVEAPRSGRRTLDQITGMTAQQRFIIVAMLLVMACLVGAMFLVIAGKVVLPVF